MRNRTIGRKGSFSGFSTDLSYLLSFVFLLALAVRVRGKQKSKQYQWNSTAVGAGDWTYRMVSSDTHHPPSKGLEQEVRERKRFHITGTLAQCTELVPSLSPGTRYLLIIHLKQKSSKPKSYCSSFKKTKANTKQCKKAQAQQPAEWLPLVLSETLNTAVIMTKRGNQRASLPQETDAK